MNSREAFSRQLPERFVDEIVRDPGGIKLSGELKKVTVLFADIKDFSSISKDMEPEEIVKLINIFFSGLTDIVFKNEGTLDKYIGDGLMAVFGASIWHPHDTLRC